MHVPIFIPILYASSMNRRQIENKQHPTTQIVADPKKLGTKLQRNKGRNVN